MVMGIPRLPLPKTHIEAERLVRALVGDLRLHEAESVAIKMVLELVPDEAPPTTLVAPLALPQGDTLGERIRIARQHAGVTQLSLAMAIGVTRETVHVWERCEVTPHLNHAALIAELTGCSLRWLATGTD